MVGRDDTLRSWPRVGRMERSASAWASAPRTLEGHIDTIFSKLGLEPRRGDDRRVLAVL